MFTVNASTISDFANNIIQGKCMENSLSDLQKAAKAQATTNTSP